MMGKGVLPVLPQYTPHSTSPKEPRSKTNPISASLLTDGPLPARSLPALPSSFQPPLAASSSSCSPPLSTGSVSAPDRGGCSQGSHAQQTRLIIQELDPSCTLKG